VYSTKEGVATSHINNFQHVDRVIWGRKLYTILCFLSKDKATSENMEDLMQNIGDPLITLQRISPKNRLNLGL
jgi:hypothetical protein